MQAQPNPDNPLRRIELHQEEIRRFEEEIRRVEEKIKWQRKAIAQCYGCLNVIQPCINVLMPRELLQEIFRQLMWDSIEQTTWTWTWTPPPWPLHTGCVHYPRRNSWLKVALVCRYWRSIALSFKELFSYVHLEDAFENTGLWSHLLEYSQPSPLDVSMEGLTSNVLDAIIPHAVRLSSVQIDVLDWDESDPPYEKLSGVFRATGSLVCAIASRLPARHFPKFLGLFPNVKRLHLTACDFIHYVSLPLLTHLSLLGGRFSQQQLFQMLDLLPQLEVLKLQQVLSVIPSDHNTPPSRRPLHRLIALWEEHGDDRVYNSLSEALLMPEVLQIEYWSYRGEMYDFNLVEICAVIKGRHSHILDLSFYDYSYIKLESYSPRNNAMLGDPPTIIETVHSSRDASSFNDTPFDVTTLNLHIFPSRGQPLALRFLRALSPLRVVTIHMPVEALTRRHPLRTGYHGLRNLYLFTEYSIRLYHFQCVENILRMRSRDGQPDLELLCLESSHSHSLWEDEDSAVVRKLNVIVAFLQASVRELRLPEGIGLQSANAEL